LIHLSNISCKFENRTILENISLTIGSHLCILGANGAGKSTLARAICNLVSYDGLVSIDGKNSLEISLKERSKLLSYIPAKLEIYDSFITLEAFVLLGRFAHKPAFFGYSANDKKIAYDALKLLHIEHLASHSIDALSSGERQPALIAQALAQQSKIIIFDEPTANLDPKNSKIIAEQIKGLKACHQVILITHDIPLAKFIDSPVAFIKEKKLHYYEDNFFQDATLQKLYGVSFNSLEVQYA